MKIEVLPGSGGSGLLIDKTIQENYQRLTSAERLIVNILIARLVAGRKKYGEWKPKECKKEFRQEALEEIIDALNYCAMALVRGDNE